MEAECPDKRPPRGWYRPAASRLLGTILIEEQTTYHSRSRNRIQHLHHAVQRACAEDAVRIKEKDARLRNVIGSDIASSGKTEVTASTDQFEPGLRGKDRLQFDEA